MTTDMVLMGFGMVLSVIGSLIANRLNKVADSMQELRTEVTTLNCTVSTVVSKLNIIEQNYVSKAEFSKEQAALKEMHDAHWLLYNEHNRCLHCRSDDGK